MSIYHYIYDIKIYLETVKEKCSSVIPNQNVIKEVHFEISEKVITFMYMFDRIYYFTQFFRNMHCYTMGFVINSQEKSSHKSPRLNGHTCVASSNCWDATVVSAIV